MPAPVPTAALNRIRFVLDGRVVVAPELPPTTTVLEYLRDVMHRTGTKEGCAEGDCGACTVVLGELDDGAGRVHYRAINSCIRFLPTIDGQELVTVESLQNSDDTLHPVQQALVDHNASQCGFCTPGFVMSLFALYLNSEAPDREDVVNALSGNLCRCTGYRPIIEAGLAMGAYPTPAHWDRNCVSATDRCERLRSLQRETALRLPGWFAPRSLGALAAAREADPDAVLLAGGTDVGLWVTKQLRDLPSIIYLGEVAELRQLRRDASGLWIGAAVSLSQAWLALVADYPSLAELAARFASPPVRNSGTLCGNVANGSPIGDAMPVLIALGAQVQLCRGSQTRTLALEDFYLGYQTKDLVRGEFVLAVTVPPQAPDVLLASYKVAKRIDQDISAVCAAFAIRQEGGRVVSARIAFGGLAAIPARARAVERALGGKRWIRATVDAAIATLGEDFSPLTDMRASSRYRLAAAGNLLRRFYLQHSDGAPHLRTEEAVGAAIAPFGHPDG